MTLITRGMGAVLNSIKTLKKSKKLFKILSLPILVRIGKILLQISNKLKIPTEKLIKTLFFQQFCGGETIEESKHCIKQLKSYNIGSILDYSVEGTIHNSKNTKKQNMNAKKDLLPERLEHSKQILFTIK